MEPRLSLLNSAVDGLSTSSSLDFHRPTQMSIMSDFVHFGQSHLSPVVESVKLGCIVRPLSANDKGQPKLQRHGTTLANHCAITTLPDGADSQQKIAAPSYCVSIHLHRPPPATTPAPASRHCCRRRRCTSHPTPRHAPPSP